ncbi:hypothetical protein BO83DRAFT_441644 [Aspergillus eucalypticola CBS 122712]|uniref:Mcm2 3 5 family protein n=1 Tax=Aspergillus eucalypticola (strain CBS 122712 / IBT 29274) TaxID=1448314 RepID=A0A317UPG8_ASPEC|nr:uncharacterized protein BO83DRAFT_441644 [Aspergillus eucalypticola CBS 122712]PWY63096.1 hypothetical protein BO83DRAFT_441644 [Aspergillus eucalypticola CBS 122712]
MAARSSDGLRLLSDVNIPDARLHDDSSGEDDKSVIDLRDLGPGPRDSFRSDLTNTPPKGVDHGDQPHPLPLPTNKPRRRCSGLFVTLIVLGVYTTILSGVFFVVACIKPYYGSLIGNNAGLTASSASLLSALLAKTIELSYVTVCVAFLGQLLSRRALAHGSEGVSIADMTLRTWITQPGSLLIQWDVLRYVGWTTLGGLTLIVALVAMLYTTAAEALVSPSLVMGPVQPRLLQGNVYTEYSNPYYLEDACQTPITVDVDPTHWNETCLEMEIAGRSYHDYYQYLQGWAEMLKAGNSTSTALPYRPQPHALLYDNTTVTGRWIEIVNTTALSEQHGRVVNNVTAAYPHGGLFAAARNPANKIQQPVDMSGEGKYIIQASLPSPAINVMCVGMSHDELKPLIYTEWPNHKPFNASTWATAAPTYSINTNRTVVDDLFGFSEDQGAPVFPIYPEAYNTILNPKVDNTTSIYILGSSPPGHDPKYVLCGLRGKLSGRCSAQYQVDPSGGDLSSRCEDAADRLQYNRIHRNTSEDQYLINWKSVAWEWADTVTLASGIQGDDAAIERTLMELVPSFDNTTNSSSLDPRLPSLSEALAVLAGSTALLGSQYSAFVPDWNYSEPSLDTPVVQVFNATLQSAGYASGRTSDWQQVFYVILAVVFLTNIMCLGFILFQGRGQLVTDFTEPPNLFALAVNSPETVHAWSGAQLGAAGTPRLRDRWHVDMREESGHYYIRTHGQLQHFEDRAAN